MTLAEYSERSARRPFRFRSATVGTPGTPKLRWNFCRTIGICWSSIFCCDRDKRVVTLVPQVFDWLEGEGTVDTPGYQEQDLGQP